MEVHLVERQDAPASLEQEEPEEQTPSVPGMAAGLSDLTALEKEALIVGRRIQTMVQGTAQRPGGPEFVVWDKESKCYRPVQYRDIVI